MFKKKNKKKYTPEMIEEVLLEKFRESNKKTLDCFVSSIEEYIEKFEGKEKVLSQAAPFFSAMSTAQYICMETVRNVLIELLCDDKETVDKD